MPVVLPRARGNRSMKATISSGGENVDLNAALNSALAVSPERLYAKTLVITLEGTYYGKAAPCGATPLGSYYSAVVLPDLPNVDYVKLINNANIYGQGGNGGKIQINARDTVGNSAVFNNPQANGGLCLFTRMDITIDNTNGKIWAGGGGGGNAVCAYEIPGNSEDPLTEIKIIFGGSGGGGQGGDGTNETNACPYVLSEINVPSGVTYSFWESTAQIGANGNNISAGAGGSGTDYFGYTSNFGGTGGAYGEDGENGGAFLSSIPPGWSSTNDAPGNKGAVIQTNGYNITWEVVGDTKGYLVP